MERIVQYQYGEGDNVGRDKIVNNYIGKSVEYSELQQRITDKQHLLSYIPEIEVAERPRISEELNALLEQETQFKNDVFRLYEAFTRIEINTERLRLAQQHFDAGKFKEARAVLYSEKMELELDALLEQTQILKEKIEENQQRRSEKANEYLILSQLTAIDFEESDWFERTKENFELSLKAERNHENLFAYAHFLQNHKQFHRAQSLYEESLNILKHQKAPIPKHLASDIAMILTNLGELHRLKNNLRLALDLHKEALGIKRELATNSQEYKLELVYSLNNLAILYQDLNNFSLALEFHEEALIILRQLCNSNPQAYLPDLTRILNNFGIFYKATNEDAKAHSKFEEALNIRRKLAEENPEIWLPYVAKILNHIGELYRKNTKLEDAQPFYEEALIIFRQFVADNPHIHLPDLALTLNNFGNLYKEKEEYTSAQSLYEEALEIYQQLIDNEPGAFIIDFARVQYNLGFLYHQIGKKDQAIFSIREVIKVLTPFSKEIPSIVFYLETAEHKLKELEDE